MVAVRRRQATWRYVRELEAGLMEAPGMAEGDGLCRLVPQSSGREGTGQPQGRESQRGTQRNGQPLAAGGIPLTGQGDGRVAGTGRRAEVWAVTGPGNRCPGSK